MPAPDLAQGYKEAGSQIDAIKDYNQTSQAEKSIY